MGITASRSNTTVQGSLYPTVIISDGSDANSFFYITEGVGGPTIAQGINLAALLSSTGLIAGSQVSAAGEGIFLPITIAQPAGTAAATFAVTQPIFAADNSGATYSVQAVSARYSTAGGSGCTVTFTVDAAAGAPGSGTAQLTTPMVLTTTANTTVNGTVVASPAVISAGMSLGMVFAGTVTGLAGFTVTVVLKRIA